jgi:ABC-2 type transport system permease protein
VRLLWSFLRRDAALAASYRASSALSLLTVLITVPLLSFLARVFAGAETPALGAYQGQYFAFLLLGMAFQDYVTLSMATFLTGIREHQLMGTLEILMLSPTPVSRLLLLSSVWGYLAGTLRFAVYVAVGLAFGLDLSGANLLSFALLAAAAIASFAALGILGAAVTLLLKQGTSITTFLTAMTLAFGGVAYPISVLPEWLQHVAWILPFTHALSALREALLLGASPAELAQELAILGSFALVLFPLALGAFSLALQRAKVAGTLGQY